MQCDFCVCTLTDATMLIKTKINNEQKYVKISQPSLEEFLNSGKPSVTHHCENIEKGKVSPQKCVKPSGRLGDQQPRLFFVMGP